MADKFEDLRTYVTVVSCGGINAAAAELGIAKSAVSRRISDLEQRLGAVLIERSTHRFEVTATGRGYFDRARELLRSLEELDADPAALTLGGSVSLAVHPAIARHLLAEALSTFLETRPGLSIDLVAADELADLHVAISRESGGRHLANTRRVLCASEAYLATHGRPASAADLRSHAGVLLDDQDGSFTLAGGAMRSPRVVATTSDTEVALALATAGCGIAQLPDFVADRAIAAGAVVELLPTAAPAAERIVATMATGAGPSGAALADHLAESLASRR